VRVTRQETARAIPEGVYSAVITPRREGEVEVDLGGMLDVIDFVASKKVTGVVLFGSTGEFLHFTQDERSRFIALATKRSRVPVLANVSHSTLDGTIAMAEEAAGSGVAGVLVMPPYFFRYDAEWVCSFFEHLGAQVSKWTPVYVYNIPAFANPLPIDVAERLLRSGHFAGIKDSSGDAAYLTRLLELQRELPIRVLCGNDRLLLPALDGGAAGIVSGLAAAVPELIVALSRAHQSGDGDATARLTAHVADLIAWIERFPIPVGLRTAAALRGMKTGPYAVPPNPEGRALLDEFRAWFRDWIKVIENECKVAAAR
jgi:4-hydroxy-tetrahydrodipicolinate synthase